MGKHLITTKGAMMEQLQLMWNNLVNSVVAYGPNILYAIGIMILFWIIAKIVSWASSSEF